MSTRAARQREEKMINSFTHVYAHNMEEKRMKLLNTQALQLVAGGGSLNINFNVPMDLEDDIAALLHNFMSGNISSLYSFASSVSAIPNITNVSVQTIGYQSQQDNILYANPFGPIALG